MCGRAAQTTEVVAFVSALLQNNAAETSKPSNNDYGKSLYSSENADIIFHNNQHDEASKTRQKDAIMDNYNMSPGMDASIFYYDKASNEIKMEKMFWGLVTKPGTTSNPIPSGMGKHFEGLMFNARSDTLYEKITFSKLAKAGKTCLIAIDGFFEWKAELKGKKQPYFVSRKKISSDDESSRSHLIIAGLWTSVPTGQPDSPNLSTYTMLTTEVCAPLKWLHSRMPVTVWDVKLGIKWLTQPNESIHRLLDEGARLTEPNFFEWHAVTSNMTSMKFRSVDAIKPLPKVKTVKSFFAVASNTGKKANSTNDQEPISKAKATKKREIDVVSPGLGENYNHCTPSLSDQGIALDTPTSLSKKRVKPGTIQSFFKPK